MLSKIIFRIDKHRDKKVFQNGINMVDLMMWLVIAALLLAAAIQGIGYYQKAAYFYQVKNDVMGGATKVLSLSGMEHNGKLSEEIVGEGLDITQTTAEVVLVADTNVDGKPMIRGTHPGIPGKEVIYLFYPYGSYQDGSTHVVDLNVMPSKWANDNDKDGIPNDSDSTPDGGAPAPDTDGDGIPDSSDSDIDGNGVPNTPWEEYSLIADSQASGATVSRTGSDGSTTTWNYNDDDTYGHSHDPISPRLLGSSQLDIIQLKSSNNNQNVEVTVRTDGTVDGADGAVGGSFNVYFHADYYCINNNTNAVRRVFAVRANGSLDATYVGGPPPPSTAMMWWGCDIGEHIDNFVIRPISEAEFIAAGSHSWDFTKDQIVYWQRNS